MMLALFEPKKTDDIREEMKPYIGKMLALECSFFQDDGNYAGQQTYVSPFGLGVPGFWIPEQDLVFFKKEKCGWD